MTAGCKVISQNKDWCTPPKYVEAVREFFGGTIHLDPCSNRHSIVNALVEYSLHQSQVIALVPVATNTGYWKKHVYGKATAICFLYDTRLRFLVDGKDGGKGAPMSCALIYWGHDFGRFFQVFIKFGAVVNIENLKAIEIGQNSNNHQMEFELEQGQ